MYDPVTAVIGGSAVLGLGGAMMSSSAAKSAANTQADAQRYAADLQYKQYLQNREDLAPWRAQGTEAVNKLGAMINQGPGNFLESPGYQFRLNEGLKAVNRAASSRGSLGSGATLKAITKYGQDYASNEYNNFLNQYYQSLTPYQSMAGLGQTAATNTAQAGTQAAALQGNYLSQAGSSQAAGQLGSVAPYSNLLNWGAGNLLNYSLLNSQNNALSNYDYLNQGQGSSSWFNYPG